MICYADDTILIVSGETIGEVQNAGRHLADKAINKIQSLGLRVATNKTEAILFLPRKKRWEDGLTIKIGDSDIPLKPNMKYLGVIIDRKWNYWDHVNYAAKKGKAVSLALGRLMPNLRGPNKMVRLLYSNVIHSVLLYAAPAWHTVFRGSRMHWGQLMAVQRHNNVRTIAGYCTLSAMAANLLSGVPPLDVIARGHRRIYEWKVADRKGIWNEEWPVEEIRTKMMDMIYREWEDRIGEHSITTVTLSRAFMGLIKPWKERRFGSLNYWGTQMLTGHGSFGSYVKRIGKSSTDRCQHCDDGPDTAEHTLVACPAWCELRSLLTEAAKKTVKPDNIVEVMLSGKDQWEAVLKYCEVVMSAKAQAERNVEQEERNTMTGWKRRRKKKRN